MKIHVCPQCGGKLFSVTAHVTQDWVVDGRGFYDRCTNECVEVTHRPDNDDMWSCVNCGYTSDGKSLLVDEDSLKHLSAIVIVDENWAIGKDGDQLVYLPSDLKRFKDLTSGHPVVYGRKTMATFPGGKPLKNRENFVLTSGPSVEGATTCRDLATVLNLVPDDGFVIGGASVYEQLLPHCSTVYVTKVLGKYDADSFFPNLDNDENWILESESDILEENCVSFKYACYRRR